MKSTNRVYNSSLPASIYTDRTKVEKSLRTPKFSVGPTSPKPGPTLPRHVMTDEKHVIKSAFSKAIRMAPKKIARIYRNVWLAMAVIVSLGIVLPLSFMVSTTFG